MRRFVNYYHFYLRVVTYGLPFLSFGAARYLLRSVGHPDTGLDRYSYFNLLLFMTVIWAIVSEYYRVTSVQELFRERTGIRAAFSTCAAAYAVLLAVLFFFHLHRNLSRILLGLSGMALLFATLTMRAGFRNLVHNPSVIRSPNRVFIVESKQFARSATHRFHCSSLDYCDA